MDTFAQGRAYSDEWTAATVDLKDQIVQDVSRMLSGQEVWWFGEPLNSTQALSFPRTGVKNFENTATLPSNAVPKPILDIFCEMSIQLAKQRRKDQATQQPLSMKVPGLEMGFQASDATLSLAVFPDAVLRMIEPYGKLSVSRPTGSLVRKLWG